MFFYSKIKRFSLILPRLITSAGLAISLNTPYINLAQAAPAPVFSSHLDEIRSQIPQGLAMRLPSELLISGESDIDETKLVVRWFASGNPKRFNVSVFTCEKSPLPCLLGSFSVERADQTTGKLELQRHQQYGKPITLNSELKIKGYLLEGNQQRPAYSFSTVMWQQDNLLYTVSFPVEDRQNILFMAYAMAHEDPIFSTKK